MKITFLVFLHLAFICSLVAQTDLQIHKKALLVDTHNDFISSSIEEQLNFNDDLRGRAHSDLQRMFEGGVDVQIFSIYCDDTYGRGTAFAYANREIDSLYAIAARNPVQLQYPHRQ